MGFLRFGTMVRSVRADWRVQVVVGLAVLIGLFFMEYPPMFVLGYWSWGATAHKTLTGMLLILNLIAAQYVAKSSWVSKRTSHA